MPKKLTTEEWIAKVYELCPNTKYDYSMVKYEGVRSRVKIICPEAGHGVFEQIAQSHLIPGRGCPMCSDKFSHTKKWIDKQRMYDIIAKIGMPCIFIRYNPDAKDSCKEVLLDKIKGYLALEFQNEEQESVWDDFGFKVNYLYYK